MELCQPQPLPPYPRNITSITPIGTGHIVDATVALATLTANRSGGHCASDALHTGRDIRARMRLIFVKGIYL